MRALNSSTHLHGQVQLQKVFGIPHAYSFPVCGRCRCATGWNEMSLRRFHIGGISYPSYQEPFHRLARDVQFITNYKNKRVHISPWKFKGRNYSDSSHPKNFAVASAMAPKEALLASDIQSEEDAMLYERQAEIEDREAWQTQVDKAHEHSKYVPAVTWDGLELVGGETEWNSGKIFRSFLPSHKLESPEEITVATYRAIVEVFTLLGSERPLGLPEEYEVGPFLNETRMVLVTVAEDESSEKECLVKLEYPDAMVERSVIRRATGHVNTKLEMEESEIGEDDISQKHLSGVEELHPSPEYTLESLRLQIASWGYSWHNVTLTDPKIKLALIKRITKITGIQIPDPVIHQSDTVSRLLIDITKPKASTTLFDALQTGGDLTDLKNVRIVGRRHSPVDKEQEIGRWKVIERELRARDLPVLS